MSDDLLAEERKVYGRELDGAIAWVLASAHATARHREALSATGIMDDTLVANALAHFALSVDVLRGRVPTPPELLQVFEEFSNIIQELRKREDSHDGDAIPLNPVKH